MGLLGAVGAGLAEAGGAAAKIGMEQIRAAIEADRDARLNEMRSNADLTTRARNKADAAEERGRVATEAGRMAEQRGGLISANAGLDDVNYRGDEGVGVNVQKGQQTPGARDFLAAQGDYRSVANLEEKDADNKRQDARDKVSAEHSDRDYKLREKQFAQGSQMAALQVKTAQLAYDRAVEEKKIPVSVAKSFDAAKSQYHDLLTISSKADFDPASETGKRVLSEQAAVSKRMADLMTPYLPEGMKAEKPKTDRPPLDSFGAKKAATPEKKASPGLIGGTSGGHFTQSDTSNESSIRAAIEEKSARAALKGIDPQLALKLRQEIADLQSRLPNSGRRLQPLPGM